MSGFPDCPQDFAAPSAGVAAFGRKPHFSQRRDKNAASGICRESPPPWCQARICQLVDWITGRNIAAVTQPTKSASRAVKARFVQCERDFRSLRMVNVPNITARHNQPPGPMARTALVNAGRGTVNPANNSWSFVTMTKNIAPQRRKAPARIHEKAFTFMLL